MTRRSIKPFVQILLLGLLLSVPSIAHADAITMSSVSFSSLQITPAAGTIMFTAPTAVTATTQALISLGENDIDFSNTQPIAQANAAVTFANSSATTNASAFSADANSSVALPGCGCSAVSFGIASLSGNFVILGGTGNVNVTISGLFTTLQSAMIDQSGLLAQSDVSYSIAIDDVLSFSNAFTVVAVGSDMSNERARMDQITAAVSLEFNVTHTISIVLQAQTTGIDETPVPEPASVGLLMSGLGCVAGFLKKRKKTRTTP
jgi:hypothetical protein